MALGGFQHSRPGQPSAGRSRKLGKRAYAAGKRAGVTDFGQAGYGGACPPKGDRAMLFFTVYALDVADLGVGAQASPAMIGFGQSTRPGPRAH